MEDRLQQLRGKFGELAGVAARGRVERAPRSELRNLPPNFRTSNAHAQPRQVRKFNVRPMLDPSKSTPQLPGRTNSTSQLRPLSPDDVSRSNAQQQLQTRTPHSSLSASQLTALPAAPCLRPAKISDQGSCRKEGSALVKPVDTQTAKPLFQQVSPAECNAKSRLSETALAFHQEVMTTKALSTVASVLECRTQTDWLATKGTAKSHARECHQEIMPTLRYEALPSAETADTTMQVLMGAKDRQASADQEGERLRKENEELLSSVHGLRAQLEAVTKERDLCQSSVASLQKECRVVEEGLLHANTSYMECSERLESRVQMASQLEDEVRRLRSENEDLQDRCCEAEFQRSRAEEQVQQLWKQIDSQASAQSVDEPCALLVVDGT